MTALAHLALVAMALAVTAYVLIELVSRLNLGLA